MTEAPGRTTTTTAMSLPTLQQNAFSEFGVNLTALVGTSALHLFLHGHTRTSPGPRQDDPITSELKDFAGPEPLPLCGLIWEKRDGDGHSLAGATFSLCRTHDLNGNDIADECQEVTDNQPPDADTNDGYFDVTLLEPGIYRVCEIAAPAGYILDPVCRTTVVTGPGVFSVDEAFVNTTPSPTPSPEPTPSPTPSPTPEPTPGADSITDSVADARADA